MLNQVAIVAFYNCFEEQKGQFCILVVGKGLKIPQKPVINAECWLLLTDTHHHSDNPG